MKTVLLKFPNRNPRISKYRRQRREGGRGGSGFDLIEVGSGDRRIGVGTVGGVLVVGEVVVSAEDIIGPEIESRVDPTRRHRSDRFVWIEEGNKKKENQSLGRKAKTMRKRKQKKVERRKQLNRLFLLFLY